MLLLSVYSHGRAAIRKIAFVHSNDWKGLILFAILYNTAMRSLVCAYVVDNDNNCCVFIKRLIKALGTVTLLW